MFHKFTSHLTVITTVALILAGKTAKSSVESSVASELTDKATARNIAVSSSATLGKRLENKTFDSPEAFYNTLHRAPEVMAAPVGITGDGNNYVVINSLKDLPSPFQGVIKLDGKKMYQFSGIVNIGANTIDLNGAGLRGMDPGKDGVYSTATGAILRSRNVDVFMEHFAVICGTTETKGYDFQDLTGTKYLNLFAGCSVLDAPNIASQGVGTITGFNTTCIVENYWKCRDGIKVTGSAQKFTSTLNYITGVSAGAGTEFLSNAVLQDVIIQSCYYVYSGEVGIKVNEGAIIDQGRLSLNLFRGVAKLLVGFDSYSPGWEMFQNGAGVPDSKGSGFLYMNDNSAPTGFKEVTLFTKILGKTSTIRSNKFAATTASNRFVFTGKKLTTLNVTATVSGNASSMDDKSSYSIAVMKNGTEVIPPNSTVSGLARGQSFQLNLQTQVDMIANDYIELVVKSNSNTTPIVISDVLFKVSE